MDKPWIKFYEPGVPEEIPYPEGMLLQHILEKTAERFPNRPATIYPARLGQNLSEGRVSYRDLDRAATRFASGLARLGIREGDRVGLILPNCPQYLIAFFGALKAGAVLVPFDLTYEPELIERQLLDCTAETVVTTTQHYAAVKQVQANTVVTRVIVTNLKDYLPTAARFLYGLSRDDTKGSGVSADPRDYSFRQVLRQSDEAPPQVSTAPTDLALLQYEGASAALKGVMLTHRNLVSNCLQTAAWRTEAEEGHEVALCVIPFFRSSGFQLAMLNNVFLGGSLILFSEFKIEDTLAAIEKYRPTVFPCSPELYDEILDYPALRKFDLRSIRTSICSEGQLGAQVQKDWEDKTGGRLVEAFGRAEAGPLSLSNPIRGEVRRRSIGIPLPGTLARIADPAAPRLSLPPGRVGLLALQGEQVFCGYWNQPEESAKSLRDGWLITDEYAQVDPDGFFYIVEAGKHDAKATEEATNNARR